MSADARTGRGGDGGPRSGLERAVARVGDRWSLLIVEALLPGPARFGELSAAVEGIAPNVLSQRLKHLEAEGVLVARPYQRRPPRFSYELTSAGAELAGALRLLTAWGARGEDGDAPSHALCGTTLETRWFCPTCAVALHDPDDDGLHLA